MIVRILLPVATALLIAQGVCCCAGTATPANDIPAGTDVAMAVFRGKTITESNLLEYGLTLQKVLGIAMFRGPEGPSRTLRKWILDQLFAEKAQAEGLLPENLDRVLENAGKQLLVAMVQERLEEESNPTLDDMRKFYEEHQDQFREPELRTFRHIFLEVRPGADDSEWEAVRERLLGLRQRAAVGEDFAELARAYSEVASASKGGLVERVARGDIKVQEFVDTVFQLEPGELSQPIKTRYGYHLVLMEKAEPGPLRSFEDVLQRGRFQKWMSAQTQVEKLDRIARAMEQKAGVERHFDLLERLEQLPETAVLFRVGDRDFQLKDLREHLREADSTDSKPSVEKMKSMLEEALSRELIHVYALEQKLDQTPDFKRRLDFVRNRIVAENYQLTRIDRLPQLSEEVLKRHYEENRGRYSSEQAIEASQILCEAGVTPQDPQGERFRKMRAARERAESLRQRLLAGEDFAELARKESDGPMASQGGYLGRINYGSTSARFEVAAFALEEGQISEPVELKDGYVLIRVEKRYPARSQTYEEARPRIVDYLRAENYQRHQIEVWQHALDSEALRVFEQALQSSNRTE